MSAKVVSSENDVLKFLLELKGVLTDSQFDVNRDLDILLKKKSESPEDPHTTFNTLINLEFDKTDVRNEILALQISDYLETFIDDKDDTSPPFYVFGRKIKNNEVYIKVKIRDRKTRKVFCVSFHMARFPFPLCRPYNN